MAGSGKAGQGSIALAGQNKVRWVTSGPHVGRLGPGGVGMHGVRWGMSKAGQRRAVVTCIGVRCGDSNQRFIPHCSSYR